MGEKTCHKFSPIAEEGGGRVGKESEKSNLSPGNGQGEFQKNKRTRFCCEMCCTVYLHILDQQYILAGT